MKGLISFLLVVILIGTILIAFSSFVSVQDFQYKDTLSLENNYYKAQDVKHAIVHAAKKGAEEGHIIYNIKYELWKECVCLTCVQEPLVSCVIPDDKVCPECLEKPALDKEIKDRIIAHLNSLNEHFEDEFNAEGRYDIKLWCGDATQRELTNLGLQIQGDKTAKTKTQIGSDDCKEYITVKVHGEGVTAWALVRFEKPGFFGLGDETYRVIGMSMYDHNTDIGTVGFIPDTEEFKVGVGGMVPVIP